MSFSSVTLTQKARTHLRDFARIGHLNDEKNTHAEDRLSVLAQQHALMMFHKNKSMPEAIAIPKFFVSASPCSSTFHTSSKTVGCTENLIEWAKTGITVASDDGCEYKVKVRI
jgi:hypothetical protein